MKISHLSTLLSAVMLTTAFSASAIIAKRGTHTLTQSDGTEINVLLNGDERNHYYTTEDGYLLLEKANNFYYGKLDPATGTVVNSHRLAADKTLRSAADNEFLNSINSAAVVDAYKKDVSSRSARYARRSQATPPADGYPQGPGLFPGTSFPAHGQQKGLVILVQYTDVQFQSSLYQGFSGPQDYFSKMLNQPGWNHDSGTGSARDWFIDCSEGIFLPDFDVYGPVTLAHNQSYYGGNDWWGNDQHPEEMVIEACQQLDGTVNFAQYDRDNDGYIDNVYVFYAGRGEADGGGANTVWPHSWEISSATSTAYYFDGKRLDRYACSNERDAYKPDGIGTFCHEFSHVMGLPDEYSTTYTGAFTPGSWSPMDYGPYNNDGHTPPTYSAFNRYALGWILPIEITGKMNGSMGHIMSTNKAYIVKTSKAEEYFLFENRQQQGWDAYVPGHGMLVWHIDYNSSVWANNSPNNNDSHQYIDIEEADGTKSEYTRDGDPFPGTAHKTSFTDDTTPSMKTWSNVKLNLPITDIAESNGIITFKVLGGIEHVDPTTLNEATDITTESFTASWSTVTEATNYVARLSTSDVEGEGEVLYDDYNVGNVTEYTFTGLEPNTHYYLTVKAEINGSFSDPSNTIEVTTLPLTFENRRVVLSEPTEIGARSFVVNWEELDDATEYFVNVYTKHIDNENVVSYDFTDGIKNMPSGWLTNSRSTYETEAYSGQAVPALKLTTDGNYLRTAIYTADITNFSFWYRGASSSAENVMSILALVDGEWITLEDMAISNAVGGTVVEMENLPEGVRSIKILYTKKGTGYLALDDISLSWGGDVEIVPEGEYVDYSAGPANSFTVTDVAPLTRYYYTVHATDGEKNSLKSIEGKVNTIEESSSIATVNAAMTDIRVNGRNVIINAQPGSQIVVSDMMGRSVANLKARTFNTVVCLPGEGLYIVKVADKVSKVAVK